MRQVHNHFISQLFDHTGLFHPLHLLLLVGSVWAVGCDDVEKPPLCVAGAVTDCSCAGGLQGTQVCNAEGSALSTCVCCTPTAEQDTTCDGLDDDCDGRTDEEFLAQAMTCGQGACEVRVSAAPTPSGQRPRGKYGTVKLGPREA